MKDDLISRQAAIDALFDWEMTYNWDDHCREEDPKPTYIVSPSDVIERLPSAQPEIIRCKDCRHGVDYYHEGDCYCSNPKWGLTYFSGSWEFYCADAERRTDE